MGNIRKAVLALVAVVGGLVATGTESYSSATGCTPPPPFRKTCIFVNGKGLVVKYATVTNVGGPTGRAVISSTWDRNHPGHFGPVLHKGEAWRFEYNRVMNNGNKVCGSIAGLNVACVTIHR